MEYRGFKKALPKQYSILIGRPSTGSVVFKNMQCARTCHFNRVIISANEYRHYMSNPSDMKGRYLYQAVSKGLACVINNGDLVMYDLDKIYKKVNAQALQSGIVRNNLSSQALCTFGRVLNGEDLTLNWLKVTFKEDRPVMAMKQGRDVVYYYTQADGISPSSEMMTVPAEIFKAKYNVSNLKLGNVKDISITKEDYPEPIVSQKKTISVEAAKKISKQLVLDIANKIQGVTGSKVLFRGNRIRWQNGHVYTVAFNLTKEKEFVVHRVVIDDKGVDLKLLRLNGEFGRVSLSNGDIKAYSDYVAKALSNFNADSRLVDDVRNIKVERVVRNVPTQRRKKTYI